MIVLIDHHDSFVHNLARYFRLLGQPTATIAADAATAAAVDARGARAVVFSPGPCGPREAAGSVRLLHALPPEMPVLGVCLGHQIVAAAWGAEIVAVAPVHGQASAVRHDGSGLFAGLPNPMTAGRYHSLAVAALAAGGELLATAWADDGVLMAFRHVGRPIFGVQFHPESILTPEGPRLLANFLRLAGLPCDLSGPTATAASRLDRW